jgi:lipopolysaccharide export system protein LptA
MPSKVITIGAAVGVAALVLLLAVLAGGPRSGPQQNIPAGLDTPPDIFVPNDTDGGELPVGISHGFYYETHENGRLMRIRGDKLVPLPEGVGKLTPVNVKIQLAPGRELTMVADQAIVVAPDNHPREGEMSGNVVVTLYETPDGSPVDFDSDRHVVTRIYFDEPLDFDLETQQIDSEGPIFMTGPQVQFRGRGLSLNYNQLRQRIERLVIEQGQSLHYIPKPNPPPDASVKSSTQAKPQATKHNKPADTPDPGTPDNSDSATTADASPPDDTTKQPDDGAPPLQFYLATFEQLQDVRVGQDQYVIEGDGLSAIFSAKAAANQDDTASPGDSPGDTQDNPDSPQTHSPAPDASAPTLSPTTSSRSIELASSDPLRSALLHALTASIGQVPQTDSRSLATFTDQDVVITWSGRLVVSPLRDVPDELASPDDVMVSVRGKPGAPTKIRTDQGETVQAPLVSYYTHNARVFTQGTPDSPVVVNSPDMGTLTGIELSINQRQATGYVLGPGQLTGQIKNKPTDTPSPSSDTRTPTPDTRSPDTQPITVAFDTRLDLEFYLKNKDNQSTPDPASPPDNSRIKGVKTATFQGNVVVDYIDLDMTADSLTLSLLEDTPKGDDKLAVSSLEAQGNIKANVKDQDVKIQAHRLHAEPAKDQLELFGSPGTNDSPVSPALVIRPDATLAGDHLIMDQQARTVAVIGPGWFDAVQDIDDPGKTIRVTWTTRMDYDDAAGTARFVGNVKTLSVDGTDTNELMGDDLTLDFIKNETTGDRRLATATMLGNVRFRARSYATAQQQNLMTELFLTDSKKMVFTDPGPAPPGVAPAPGTNLPDDLSQAKQQVHVFGNGRMLITENRPKDPAYAKPDNNQSIDFAGRGLTAFQWTDGLVINMTDGIMTMKGAVVMVHDSDDGDRVQLDCQDLAAEIKAPTKSSSAKISGGGGNSGSSSGGGGGWLAKDAPKPELQRVWADGNIRILQGPNTVRCDHLLYQESKREIILWSDDPRNVTVEVDGEPNLTKASAIKWNRDTGRREAFKIRTGTIPIRRSEQDSHQ